jgi:hypothetical protein
MTGPDPPPGHAQLSTGLPTNDSALGGPQPQGINDLLHPLNFICRAHLLGQSQQGCIGQRLLSQRVQNMMLPHGGVTHTAAVPNPSGWRYWNQTKHASSTGLKHNTFKSRVTYCCTIHPVSCISGPCCNSSLLPAADAICCFACWGIWQHPQGSSS